LFNFGKKPDFKRAIFSNERKEISEIETSNPCNQRHPRSICLDEYYFINPTTMPITQPFPYPAIIPLQKEDNNADFDAVF
jgi:hypothetical protein